MAPITSIHCDLVFIIIIKQLSSSECTYIYLYFIYPVLTIIIEYYFVRKPGNYYYDASITYKWTVIRCNYDILTPFVIISCDQKRMILPCLHLLLLLHWHYHITMTSRTGKFNRTYIWVNSTFYEIFIIVNE